MRARFWGVRGSFPVSAPEVARYGGNTPCVEVDVDGRALVIDAGTGIRGLGRDLRARGVSHIDLLLSHAHWDHIQGFPHFEPLGDAGVEITVHALRHPRHRLEDLLAAQQRQPFFPVSLDAAAARLRFVEHEDGDTFDAGAARVTVGRLNHPGVTGGFRVEAAGRVLTYLSDLDLNGDRLLAAELSGGDAAGWLARLRQGAGDLSHGADALIGDTFFDADDYDPTWGHSRVEDFVGFAAETGMRNLYLFHHRPSRGDDEIDAVLRGLPAVDGCRIHAAREGLELAL